MVVDARWVGVGSEDVIGGHLPFSEVHNKKLKYTIAPLFIHLRLEMTHASILSFLSS